MKRLLAGALAVIISLIPAYSPALEETFGKSKLADLIITDPQKVTEMLCIAQLAGNDIMKDSYRPGTPEYRRFQQDYEKCLLKYKRELGEKEPNKAEPPREEYPEANCDFPARYCA